VAGLVPSIRHELERLRSLIPTSPPSLARRGSSVNHTSVLEVAESLARAAGPALGFFFAHPSQRLSKALVYLADETATMVTWLEHRPPTETDTPPHTDYHACCERIQCAIRDWRLAIRLELVAQEIDEEQPETLH
jgi:hypothetical protein